MLLRVLDLRETEPPFDDVLPRPDAPGADVRDAVARILAEVQAEGDAAVVRRTAEFDQVDLSRGLRVPAAEIDEAVAGAETDLRSALKVAYDRILTYHAQEGTP